MDFRLVLWTILYVMDVPLLDLKPQFQPLRDRILNVLREIADSQSFILGPKVEQFERAICEYTGAAHAIGVSSGTDALLAALMALDLGPGEAVITSPYSFFATAGCITRTGARPVFIDIDPATFNLSVPALRSFIETQCQFDEDCILTAPTGERIRMIVPVHLFGLCADMDGINAIAAEYDLAVVEDAAQALGAQYPSKNGPAFAGAMGDFGCYSFFPSKNLGCFGDGGLVTCRDAAMADKVRILRNHGMAPQYFHKIVGGNFRLDAIQAAILSIKLPHLDAWSSGRRRNAERYRALFAESGVDRIVTLPSEPYSASGNPRCHIYNQFVIRAPRRDALLAHLKSHGVGHAVYYPVPLHVQECFSSLGFQPGAFPESEKAAKETVALPIFPELSEGQQSYVADTIARFYH